MNVQKYHVFIKSNFDKKFLVVVTDKPVTKRMAEKIERGANINLNHAEYYTELVPEVVSVYK